MKAKIILISCTVQNPTSICPNCGLKTARVNQYYIRELRDLNMGIRQVHLLVKMRQFHCPNCNRYFSELLDFEDQNKEHTHRQTDYMFCLARKQSYSKVAAIVNTSPTTVERAVLSVCAKTCFPNAKIILDRFHIVKALNELLDEFRKELRKTDTQNAHYKKMKWILYKQFHTLSDTQIDDLENAFQDCPEVEKIYHTREQFHHILDNSENTQIALEKIKEWIANIRLKNMMAFDKFIKMIEKPKEYVANYVIDFLSNAVTEGLNNLIRSVRRTTFGMTNFNHLKLRVLAIST